eukprot:CAMPEP_0198664762 /NCGR_PEP_ID=MMETSP1467-20131203/57439_1 /TAXON_ID=1462469 /ORGANISM="unid. sp., Strain CCMP2135" /LENGTH=101 /DNA_ID=CAMNT_0044401339 /DNA_START=268 /DNA_END=572 /DNA_ORIENTATION=+
MAQSSSLPALFDDDGATASRLLNHAQLAPHKLIGGDVDASEIADATLEHRKHWLVVRGISDFPALVAGRKTTENETLAAAAAADFVDWLLRQKLIDRLLEE